MLRRNSFRVYYTCHPFESPLSPARSKNPLKGFIRTGFLTSGSILLHAQLAARLEAPLGINVNPNAKTKAEQEYFICIQNPKFAPSKGLSGRVADVPYLELIGEA